MTCALIVVAELPKGIRNFGTLSNSLPMWLAFYSLPMWHSFFRHNLFSFSLKHLRCRPCAKVICQIPEGSDCFVYLIPRVCQPPPTVLGENIDRCIEFKFYLNQPLVFPVDYPFWISLRTRYDSVSPVFSLWQCTKYSTSAMRLRNL